jgi:hypothetical protein
MTKDWKNTVKRVIKTFIQAALGYAAVNATGLIGDDGIKDSALAAFLVASIAAGLAALMNLPDHSSKSNGIEEIKGAAIIKRIDDDYIDPSDYDTLNMLKSAPKDYENEENNDE